MRSYHTYGSPIYGFFVGIGGSQSPNKLKRSVAVAQDVLARCFTEINGGIKARLRFLCTNIDIYLFSHIINVCR